MPAQRRARQQSMLDEGNRGPYGSLRRALRLLEAVDRCPGGATPAALARELSLPDVVIRDLAEVLEAEGYLCWQDGAWTLGGTFALLGQSNRADVVRAKLEQKLADLRDELGAAVYFSRYQDGELSIEAVSTADYAPPVHEWVDFRASAHATAIGKCLLGQLDHDGRRDHIARHPAARLTARTITDQEQLLHRLECQPATVPVLDLQEYSLGTVCAAVPVSAGSTVGCLGTSLPADQLYRLREVADILNQRAAPLMLAMAV